MCFFFDAYIIHKSPALGSLALENRGSGYNPWVVHRPTSSRGRKVLVFADIVGSYKSRCYKVGTHFGCVGQNDQKTVLDSDEEEGLAPSIEPGGGAPPEVPEVGADAVEEDARATQPQVLKLQDPTVSQTCSDTSLPFVAMASIARLRLLPLALLALYLAGPSFVTSLRRPGQLESGTARHAEGQDAALATADGEAGDSALLAPLKVASLGMGLLKPVFAAEAKLQALAYDEEEIRAKIAAEVKSAPVVVYTYSLSPFCTEATKLLDALGAEYKEIQLAPEWFLMLGENAAKRAELGALYGRTSMPHIFIGGESIGGLMDGPGLVPLYESGELQEKLRAAGSLPADQNTRQCEELKVLAEEKARICEEQRKELQKHQEALQALERQRQEGKLAAAREATRLAAEADAQQKEIQSRCREELRKLEAAKDAMAVQKEEAEKVERDRIQQKLELEAACQEMEQERARQEDLVQKQKEDLMRLKEEQQKLQAEIRKREEDAQQKLNAEAAKSKDQIAKQCEELKALEEEKARVVKEHRDLVESRQVQEQELQKQQEALQGLVQKREEAAREAEVQQKAIQRCRKELQQLEAAKDAIVARQVDEEKGSAQLRSSSLAPSIGRSDEDAKAKYGNTSKGSLGHPEVCGRFCIRFFYGNCRSGQNCEFCHLEHREPKVKMDKVHRQFVETMGEAEVLALVLPHLERRNQRMLFVIDMLRRRLASLPHPDDNHVLQARAVLPILRKFTVARLLEIQGGLEETRGSFPWPSVRNPQFVHLEIGQVKDAHS
eukprot:s588_g11.t1